MASAMPLDSKQPEALASAVLNCPAPRDSVVRLLFRCSADGGMNMRALLVAMACFPLGVPLEAPSGRAETPHLIALTGRVSSAEEGPMEGVLISAKKPGTTMTITVVSDDQGRYQF